MGKTTPPWGARGSQPEDTDTAHYLERVLKPVPGCKDIARRAGEYHFDGYRCPDDVADGLEMQRLVNELEFKKKLPWQTPESVAMLQYVIDAVKQGEFDNTREESAEWADTPEGRATFDLIFGTKRASEPPTSAA